MKFNFSVFFLLFSITSFAESFDFLSAKRDPNIPGEVYEEWALRALEENKSFYRTAIGSARKYSSSLESNLPSVTSWSSSGTLHSRFKKIRDSRFIKWNSRSGFPRRISWLYPDDGCYARASMAVKKASDESYSLPNKVFAFGSLRVKTRNSPRGRVAWWYHVAPVVEVNNTKYVIDPAIEPSRPLKLKEWLGRMGTPTKIKVAICESGAYSPRGNCDRKSEGRERSAASSLQRFLTKEWNRITSLGRSPTKELGDNPPW